MARGPGIGHGAKVLVAGHEICTQRILLDRLQQGLFLAGLHAWAYEVGHEREEKGLPGHDPVASEVL